MDELKKLGRVGVTPGKMVDAIDALIDLGHSALQQRFLSALKSEAPYTYIVTGDSTRKSGELDSSEYYAPQLEKINFDLFMNSSGGQSAMNWSQDNGNSTVQEAIDATSDTGATTILEMSLGINQGARTVNEVKAFIIAGLNKYLVAKPDALIIFVSPNETGTPANSLLDAMYKTLPIEFENSVYVSGKKATTEVHKNDDYYLDFTHPNFNGLRRLVNYVFSSVLPTECKCFMSITDTPIKTPSSALGFTVQNGSWYRGGGDVLRFKTDNSEHRSTTLIDVEPNFIIKLDTGGDNSSYYFADKDNLIISTGYASYHDGAGGEFRSVKAPLGAEKFAYNFATDGATWDATNKTPAIEYLVNETKYISQRELNNGNLLSLPFIPNTDIDHSGNLPTAGQTQQGQEDGTWLWA